MHVLCAQFHGVHSLDQDFQSDQLKVPEFKEYLQIWLDKFPVLTFIMKLLFSITHLHKLKADSTSSQWLEWHFMEMLHL